MFRRLITIAAAYMLAAAILTAQAILPDGKGKEILDNYCQECHGLDPIIRQSLSDSEWRTVIARMVKRGANLKPADVDIVVDYLTSYFGRDSAIPTIEINRATPEEIQKFFGIPASEASALVKYRSAHGPFRNWDALVNARAADVKKLAAKKEAIVFANANRSDR